MIDNCFRTLIMLWLQAGMSEPGSIAMIGWSVQYRLNVWVCVLEYIVEKFLITPCHIAACQVVQQQFHMTFLTSIR